MAPFHSALAFIESVGGPELLLVLFIALLLFGGEKLPGLARTMGKTINQLKKASGEVERELKKAMEEDPAAQSGANAVLPAAPASDKKTEAEPASGFPPLPEAKLPPETQSSVAESPNPDGQTPGKPSNQPSGDADPSQPGKGLPPS